MLGADPYSSSKPHAALLYRDGVTASVSTSLPAQVLPGMT